MNLIILAALVAACGAAKLDRTYLPPASAKTAGGSPGALQAPNSFSQNAAPKGSYTNEFQGVVVDAALAGTRASGSEESGLGGPRNSYGSTASKVGDAAFRGSLAGFRFPVGTQDDFGSHSQFGDSRPETNNQFGGAKDSAPERIPAFGASRDSTPERSQVFGVPEGTPAFEASRPERPQAAQERAASILRFESEVGPESFNYAFETDNGISAEETGVATNGVQAQGGFSYTGDDGKVYTVTYTADEGGYQPRGDHLPTPPPIPEEILKSLEQNARDEANGVIDDGLYDAQKYNEAGDYTESDSVNGKLNSRPSVNTGNSDVDASGTFINQNNLPFNPNPSQRGSDNRTPVNRFQSTTNDKGKLQSNSANGNRFGSRNNYLPPFSNQNKPQNLRPQAPSANVPTPDVDSSSTFQRESTEEGSGGFHSDSENNYQAPIQPSSSSSFPSRPDSENQFNNGFKGNGSPNRNQFNKNGNRFPSSQGNRQQFSVAPTNAASHVEQNQFSPQSSSSLNYQHSTSIPDTELTTPFESISPQDAVQPSAPSVSSSFGFNAQPSRPSQKFGFHNTPTKASLAPAQPTIPGFAQSRPQASNNRPIVGNRNTQSTFSTQAQQAQTQFSQQSQFGNTRQQFSQDQFSQNFDNQFAPSTQKPQFAQQSNAQDDSYYYNQPSRVFNTPQGSRFSSAPSNQFDRVTKRPSFSSQTNQYSEEPNYPSTPFPSQNGQRQGSTRYPRPPTFPTEPTPSVNQYQVNAIASTANGITQASASSFATPTSPTGFNRQQFSQTRQQYQQSSFQPNGPSSEPKKTSFGIQTTAQTQSIQGQSQFEQQNFEKAQPLSQQPLQDVKQPKLDNDENQGAPETVTNQQYNGEIYEYNKPAEMLPPPEDGFGQFGKKVQSSQSTQTKTQFSQTPSVEPRQAQSRPSIGSPKPVGLGQTVPQGGQFNTQPQFPQTSIPQQEQPTSGPSFGLSKPMRFSQTIKAPQGDQFGAQTAEQEQSTDDFSIKPSREPLSHQSQVNQHGNNQFGGQRRPFSSQSESSFSSSSVESPKSFGGLNGRPSCCRTSAEFDQPQNFRQASRPSQFGGESQFGQSQSSFQSSSGFKPDQSQSVAGKGEIFGGPRKPPSFDDTGYHY